MHVSTDLDHFERKSKKCVSMALIKEDNKDDNESPGKERKSKLKLSNSVDLGCDARQHELCDHQEQPENKKKKKKKVNVNNTDTELSSPDSERRRRSKKKKVTSDVSDNELSSPDIRRKKKRSMTSQISMTSANETEQS